MDGVVDNIYLVLRSSDRVNQLLALHAEPKNHAPGSGIGQSENPDMSRVAQVCNAKDPEPCRVLFLGTPRIQLLLAFYYRDRPFRAQQLNCKMAPKWQPRAKKQRSDGDVTGPCSATPENCLGFVLQPSWTAPSLSEHSTHSASMAHRGSHLALDLFLRNIARLHGAPPTSSPSLLT